MDSRCDDRTKPNDAAIDFPTRVIDSAGWFLFAAFLARPAIDSLLRPDALGVRVLKGMTCLVPLAVGIVSFVGKKDRSPDARGDNNRKTDNPIRRLPVRIPDGVVWLFMAAYVAVQTVDSLLRRDDLAAGLLGGIAFLALLLAGILSLTRRAT